MPWGQAVTRSGFPEVPAVCSAPHALDGVGQLGRGTEDDVKPTMRRLPNVLLLFAVLALLAACSTSPYQGAPRVLYFYDSFYGEDDPFVLDALFENGFLVHKTHDIDELHASMRSRDFDLTILLVQETGPAALELDTERLEQYLATNGRVILVDWRRDGGIAELFDASYTGRTNDRIVSLAPPLSPDVGERFLLARPGWLTFSMGLAPAEGGESLCTFDGGDSCVVVGNDGRSALLGMLADALPEDRGEAFWRNLTNYLLE